MPHPFPPLVFFYSAPLNFSSRTVLTLYPFFFRVSMFPSDTLWPLSVISQRYPTPDTVSARIAEIQRLEEGLRNERLSLQVLVNRQHNANLPISCLPKEVLQTILRFDRIALDGTRQYAARNAELMAVSHHWMLTTYGYAFLWSTINVTLAPRHFQKVFQPENAGPNYDPLSHPRMSILVARTQAYVERSKNSLLHLSLSPGMNDVVERIIGTTLSRVSRLEFNAFSPLTRDAPPLPNSHLLSSLTDLKIDAQKRGNNGVCIPLLPNLAASGTHLRRLTLSTCDYKRTDTFLQQLPLSVLSNSLTYLNVHDSLDPLSLMEVLLECNYLQYVKYTRDATEARKAPRPPQPTSAFPPEIFLMHLVSLIISGENDVLVYLGKLAAPRLKHLEVRRTYNPGPHDEHTLLPVWIAPPPGHPRFGLLQTMTLLYLGEWTAAGLEMFFKTHTKLQWFHSIALSDENVEGMRRALENESVCPHLRVLKLQIQYTPLSEPALWDCISRIVGPRRRALARSAHEAGETDPAPDFTIRIDGVSQLFATRLGELLGVAQDEVVGTIKSFEIREP
ncbi:hypothetical protein DL93DRAFT_2087332 [Clavulina sp. PMI_390]|nr:hypothetical protein DL93DRAFT_2087332 [Clavulina sp. PMI_390]